MEIVIATNESFVYIQVNCPDETSLSWEQLQQIKDKYYPEKDFIEVYPMKSEIINKANVRHLIHLKGFECPKLKDLETECDIEVIENHYEQNSIIHYIPNKCTLEALEECQNGNLETIKDLDKFLDEL